MRCKFAIGSCAMYVCKRQLCDVSLQKAAVRFKFAIGSCAMYVCKRQLCDVSLQ